MKKIFKLSLALMCCIIMGMSLSSCGDDGPVLTGNVNKADLTNPMFLFLYPNSEISTIINGFTFYSFTENRVAHGTFNMMGIRPFLKCDAIYDSWNLGNGTITIGSGNASILQVNILGVKAYDINGLRYLPSNNTVASVKAEDIFTKIHYDKDRLWRALEAAKNNGVGVYMDEVE
ncbi:MAG: hypothetical protein IJR20_03320 [Muribaculaceae bacterium]|nr:hypothetical protein [Muribaculaceae bacterium]